MFSSYASFYQHVYSVCHSVGKNCSNNDNESEKKSPCSGATVWSVSKEKTAESLRSLHNSHTYSKKGIKHALRQQAKRRRKNTTIAAGNSAPLPRFVTPTSVDSKSCFIIGNI